jgi:hypothetical protein
MAPEAGFEPLFSDRSARAQITGTQPLLSSVVADYRLTPAPTELHPPTTRMSHRFPAGWLLVVAACVCLWTSACAASIDDDETVILFPAFAVQDGRSSWTAHIHGWIYEPTDGETRLFLLGELERLLRRTFDLHKEDLESRPASSTLHLAERAGMFLVDHERRKRVAVTIAGDTFTLGRSELNGHFEGEVTLNEATRRSGVPDAAAALGWRSGEWTEVRAVTRPGDPRVFAGKVQFIERHGIVRRLGHRRYNQGLQCPQHTRAGREHVPARLSQRAGHGRA